MQENVGLLGLVEEGVAAVAMISKYNGQICDDKESKQLATVQPLSLH